MSSLFLQLSRLTIKGVATAIFLSHYTKSEHHPYSLPEPSSESACLSSCLHWEDPRLCLYCAWKSVMRSQVIKTLQPLLCEVHFPAMFQWCVSVTVSLTAKVLSDKGLFNYAQNWVWFWWHALPSSGEYFSRRISKSRTSSCFLKGGIYSFHYTLLDLIVFCIVVKNTSGACNDVNTSGACNEKTPVWSIALWWRNLQRNLVSRKC